MFFARVKVEDLGQRIDPEYHNPELLAMKKKVHTAFSSSSFKKECRRMNSGPFGSALLASDYVDKSVGVMFIRPQDCKDLIVDTDNENVFISHADNERLKSSSFSSGAIIITKIGNGIGDMAVIPENIKTCNISGNAMGAVLNNHDPYFSIAYLRGKYGQAEVKRGLSGGPKPKIDMESIGDIVFPIIQNAVQKYIGDKVRQSERLRAWANALDINIATYFADLVANPLPPRVSWLAKKEDLNPYRINPKQYDPVVLELIHRAKANDIRLEPLSGLTGSRQIAGGATPKGAHYFDKGVLFARVQNVKPLRLDLSDAVYIDQSADEELARSRCAKDDIILTITGYPGTASLVTEEDLPVNINQHSVRFNIRDDIEPGYVCAALNSKFLKYQIDRLAIGGTRDALDYPSVGRLLIPRYEAKLEQKIGEQARSVIAAEKLSRRLTNAAKLLVEALIEGQVTEVELITAEQALQAGNDVPDRRILNRLKTDGIDAQGQPLFPDLDQLYNLLEQASHS